MKFMFSLVLSLTSVASGVQVTPIRSGLQQRAAPTSPDDGTTSAELVEVEVDAAGESGSTHQPTGENTSPNPSTDASAALMEVEVNAEAVTESAHQASGAAHGAASLENEECQASAFCDHGCDMDAAVADTSKSPHVYLENNGEWQDTVHCIDQIQLSTGCVMEVATETGGGGKKFVFPKSSCMKKTLYMLSARLCPKFSDPIGWKRTPTGLCMNTASFGIGSFARWNFTYTCLLGLAKSNGRRLRFSGTSGRVPLYFLSS